MVNFGKKQTNHLSKLLYFLIFVSVVIFANSFKSKLRGHTNNIIVEQTNPDSLHQITISSLLYDYELAETDHYVKAYINRNSGDIVYKFFITVFSNRREITWESVKLPADNSTLNRTVDIYNVGHFCWSGRGKATSGCRYSQYLSFDITKAELQTLTKKQQSMWLHGKTTTPITKEVEIEPKEMSSFLKKVNAY